MAAKIPITETKAYQLLKWSTLQDNTNQTEDRFQKADASASQLSGGDKRVAPPSEPYSQLADTRGWKVTPHICVW
ncbi:centrosomal protein kizuna-like [Diceros bicornis minor]|uniref:centrosomal protein kizuna-like n=1 Tax=Diceros bicornis minor TaxID=77932 RepID=UPI0026EB0A0E|nr:centrosomal protein kizuna-like [Diceros bicornis minor]